MYEQHKIIQNITRTKFDHCLEVLCGCCKNGKSVDSTIPLKTKTNIDVLGVHEAQFTTRALCDNLRLYDDNSSRLYGLHTWLQCESIRARCKNSLEETNITSDEDRQAVDILQEYFYLVIQ